MSDELDLQTLQEQFLLLYESQNVDELTNEVSSLREKTLRQDFWNDDLSARETMQVLSQKENHLNELLELKKSISSLVDLEGLLNDSVDDDLQLEFTKERAQVTKRFILLKTQSYLSGEYDSKAAIVSIHSGQGGTEAMDWAAMLQRMYMRYFERRDLSYQLVDISSGDEAGIKSATFTVTSPMSYGYLKGENGTHRLVRLSPFNSDNLRQTSFAGVEVIPLIPSAQSKVFKDEDLEWQFYRSGGSGGQNVNKVNTAVRVKHVPSGIVVSSTAERTQIRNREIALQILESKLEQKRQQEEAAKQQEIKGEHKIAGWGNQIRSYVLHPYKMVKDTRTGVETSNTDGVLDGDIQAFIDAEIAWLATQS